MTSERSMADPLETTIPGRNPIELIAYYEEFRDYYPYCELETKRWFVDHVRADWWMFDIGANVGYYTILFSQLATRGRVFAFEPTATAAMLRANLRHNKVENAEIHEVALAATTGEREDRIYRLWGTDGEVKTWPFSSLDDFIERHRIERVDCLKIDVDSFDFDVLRGAERTLADRNPVVIVELNHALARRNQSVGEALAWLARRGYRKALVLDNDNFMLQRGAGSFMDAGAVSSLELSFPPPFRFDEAMPPSAGLPAGDDFIGKVGRADGRRCRPPGDRSQAPDQPRKSCAGQGRQPGFSRRRRCANRDDCGRLELCARSRTQPGCSVGHRDHRGRRRGHGRKARYRPRWRRFLPLLRAGTDARSHAASPKYRRVRKGH